MLVNDPPVPDPANADRARSEDVRRQGDDLLRPLDLQVRDRRAEGRGRRADRSTRPGRPAMASTSCRERPASSSISSRRTRTWGAPRSRAGSRSTGARRCCKSAGQDFDALKKQAATRDFKPVPLGVTASMTIKNKLRTINSRNVIGQARRAPIPKLKDEYVVYTAHWDHFGKTADGIFHGAEDDALGCAALIEMARAFTKLPTPPKRSILFLAVTAEEQGLLGSQYYSVTPIYPLAKTACRHQHGQLEHARPHQGPDAGRLRRVGSRRLRARRGGRTGPHRARRRRAGEGLLLPLRSFQLREAGRAGARSGRRRRLHRQAGRLRRRRCATSGTRTGITRRRTW